MEFFQEIDAEDATAALIKATLTVGYLPSLCASIDKVIEDLGQTGTIYCLWGEFRINREELRDGVRFSLPDCPNALAWTVTFDGNRKKIVVHCTIDKQEHSVEMIESMQQFVVDWQEGLQSRINQNGRYR